MKKEFISTSNVLCISRRYTWCWACCMECVCCVDARSYLMVHISCTLWWKFANRDQRYPQPIQLNVHWASVGKNIFLSPASFSFYPSQPHLRCISLTPFFSLKYNRDETSLIRVTFTTTTVKVTQATTSLGLCVCFFLSSLLLSLVFVSRWVSLNSSKLINHVSCFLSKSLKTFFSFTYQWL